MKRLLFGLVFLFLFSPVIAQESVITKVSPKTSNVISDVQLVGNINVESQQILTNIISKAGTNVNLTKIIRDVSAIENMGFFEEVSYELKETISGSILVFQVKENPVIDEVKFVGNTIFSESELKPLLTIKENKILDYSNVRKDMKTIEALYHDKGFSLMKLVRVATPATSGKNSIVFHIVEGMVEDIRVEGNDFTKDHVVLRELKMKPGDVFNQDVLQADGRRVFNLNFFKNVVPDFAPGTKKDTVVLTWKIEEKKTNSINLGGSFGSLQGFSVFLDLHLDNFNGNGELVSVKGEWGKKFTSYQLKYRNPWIMEPKTSLTTRLWNTDSKIDESAEGEAKRIGGDLALSRQLDDYWSVTGKTKYENVEPYDDADYRLFMLGGSISYDTRDVWMNPTQGDYHSLSVENNNKLFGGTVQSTRYYINMNKFYPIMDKQTLALHASWAEIYGNVKDTERFYIGGGTTVRGYRDGEPFARGSRRAIANVEYRVTFNDMLQGVAFYDLGRMGTADDDRVAWEGDNRWRAGWGFGFRINTPLGPIRLDFGWTDPRGNVVDQTTGDKEYSAVHFNIGHAF